MTTPAAQMMTEVDARRITERIRATAREFEAAFEPIPEIFEWFRMEAI